ncbi:hypothetical protein BGZ73_004438 [Actinomortierella ambigua]|nr:hypothetical protein BGZ73_004438 [Actinomortierella ambigua]
MAPSTPSRPPRKSKSSMWSFITAPAPSPKNAHPIPALGYVLIMLIAIVWFHETSLAVKLQCVVGAALFSCTEYTFYTMTVEDPDGTVRVKPFAGRPGHTTIHQFVMNVFYIPILVHGYHAVIHNTYLRILLFPFNIWLLEIIQGYTLMYLLGYNAAWTYRGEFDPSWISFAMVTREAFPGMNTDTSLSVYPMAVFDNLGKDALFHGTIKLWYVHHWLMFGAVLELLVMPYLLPLTYQIAGSLA